jgi:hypothetical protein
MQISKQANKLASNEANKQASKLTTCANSADYDSPRILVVVVTAGYAVYLRLTNIYREGGGRNQKVSLNQLKIRYE